jgi:hypothetical protein
MDNKLARLIVRFNLSWAESLIGDLLTETFRVRLRGTTPHDRHEARHLAAALAAGNSSPCVGDRREDCHLDRATIRRLHDATWPDSHIVHEVMEIVP